MGFKDLFVVKDENQTSKEKQQEVKFPSNQDAESSAASFFQNMFTGKTTPSTNFDVKVDQDHLQKAIETYQKGFDSLAKAGYGFFQFFKAISAAGPDNPTVYPMAFMMGKTMDSSLTKDKLISDCDYYLNKLSEVYNGYVNSGNQRKQEHLTQKANETNALTSELDAMNQQLEALKIQILDRQNKLTQIDAKYQPILSDVDSKLAANDIAKNQLVDSIIKVKDGIVKNLNQ